MTLKAVLFDKDGTLFGFRATWDAWAGAALGRLAERHGVSTEAVAKVVHYDLESRGFDVSSPFVAGTNREWATALASALPGSDVETVEAFLVDDAARAPQVPSVPLVPLLSGLRTRGLELGIMTNDHESVARAHVTSAGVAEYFARIMGADSGYGAKPDPGPLQAFAKGLGIEPGQIAMVGDSLHDLAAGRAAGMRTVGVLTGLASLDTLTPLADVVLRDIGGLPAWIDGLTSDQAD